MINHVRTILLNRADSYFDDIPNSEYVSSTFRPSILDDVLRKLRQVIIPNGIDAFAENYIADILMHLLQAPDTVNYVLDLDPRLTYSLDDVGIAEFCDANVDVTTFQTTACDITFVPRVKQKLYPVGLSISGLHRWNISAIDSRTIKLVYSRGTTEELQIVHLSLPAQSETFELLGDYFTAYFEMPSGSLTGKYRYDIETGIAVPYDIPARLTAMKSLLVDSNVGVRLFDTAPPFNTEITTLLNLWQYATEPTLKYSAAILCYAYQLERYRRLTGA